MAYNNLTMGLAGLGRDSEALDAINKAVSIYKKLIPVRPEAFCYYLAHTLNSKAKVLIKLKQYEDSVIYLKETIIEYEKLVQIYPDRFLGSLTHNMDLLTSVLRQVGREDEAAENHEKAKIICEKITKAKVQ